MIILVGPHKGRSFAPHQFANDWISVKSEDSGEQALVFSPAHVRIEPADVEFFAERDPRQVGTFWGEWRLLEDGGFTPIVARPPRRVRRLRSDRKAR